jgi:hypothetical protein
VCGHTCDNCGTSARSGAAILEEVLWLLVFIAASIAICERPGRVFYLAYFKIDGQNRTANKTKKAAGASPLPLLRIAISS